MSTQPAFTLTRSFLRDMHVPDDLLQPAEAQEFTVARMRQRAAILTYAGRGGGEPLPDIIKGKNRARIATLACEAAGYRPQPYPKVDERRDLYVAMQLWALMYPRLSGDAFSVGPLKGALGMAYFSICEQFVEIVSRRLPVASDAAARFLPTGARPRKVNSRDRELFLEIGKSIDIGLDAWEAACARG